LSKRRFDLYCLYFPFLSSISRHLKPTSSQAGLGNPFPALLLTWSKVRVQGTAAHDPRLPFFDIKKPRTFYDSSYLSDMYEISRAAHKAAKENLEEQRDRQEAYYETGRLRQENK
jgi:hypothetical protein